MKSKFASIDGGPTLKELLVEFEGRYLLRLAPCKCGSYKIRIKYIPNYTHCKFCCVCLKCEGIGYPARNLTSAIDRWNEKDSVRFVNSPLIELCEERDLLLEAIYTDRDQNRDRFP